MCELSMKRSKVSGVFVCLIQMKLFLSEMKTITFKYRSDLDCKDPCVHSLEVQVTILAIRASHLVSLHRCTTCRAPS